jgi:hypothetical protein
MINSSVLGFGLLAYASYQTIYFLKDKGGRIWARPRYHRYSPRPTRESVKYGQRCGGCSSFCLHSDYQNSGTCGHESWKLILKSDEVMVRRDGHCELWEKNASADV